MENLNPETAINKSWTRGPLLKFLLIFLVCIPFAPVPLYFCFDDCGVSGFNSFIIGPITLFGFDTLFHLLPWILAIIFGCLGVIVVLITEKIYVKLSGKKSDIGVIFTCLILLFIIFRFTLNNHFHKAEYFNYYIQEVMKNKDIYPNHNAPPLDLKHFIQAW